MRRKEILMKKLTLIGITLSLVLGFGLWQQKHFVAAKATPMSQAPIVVDDFNTGAFSTSGYINDLSASPEMDVQGNSLSIADGDITPYIGDQTDFGSADVSSGTVSRSFALYNTGTSDLNLNGTPKVQINGAHATDFNVTLEPSSLLPFGTFTIFAIQFNPSAPGLRTATVSIDNNDSDENPYDFAIQGTGTVACAFYTDNRAYVNASATGGNNGASWTDALTDLQDALAAANACPSITEIWVAQGAYKPTTGTNRTISFVMKNNLAIYGGFNGTETMLSQRNWVTNVTTLSGDLLGDDGPNFANNSDNSTHVISNSGLDNTAVLDGFTITRANGISVQNGGGMINNNASPTVTNCVFSGNMMSTAGVGGGGGGGMTNHNSSSPIVTYCTFTGNLVTGAYGGGMFNLDSSPIVSNCTFSGNTTTGGGGGGMYNQNSAATVTNCTFSGNSAAFGGGIGLFGSTSSSAVVTNCIFSGNEATTHGAGGMFIQNSSPTITNCSFSGNNATANGGAVRLWGAINTPTFINCILWGNNSPEIFIDAGSSITVTNSIVQQASGVYPGTDNLNQNPLFVSQPPIALGTSGDLHLQAGSPAIDAGTNTGAPSTDIEGNPRPLTAADPADMGADEAQFVTVAVTTSPAGLGMTVDGNPYTSPQTFQWVPGSNHTIATTSPQSLVAFTRYVFLNWSDDGAISHSVTAPASATSYTASFKTQHQLTTSAGAGGAISPASEFYDEGNVLITATPDPGYSFTGFGGDLTGMTNPQLLNLTGPASVTASFAPTCSMTTATVSGGGASCPGGSSTVTVTLSGGTAPYTVTLSNGGGTLTGNSPLNFTVSPASTTTYTVQSATDANGCPVTASGSAMVTIGSDNIAPTLTLKSPITLWPADSAYRTVTVSQMVQSVSDNCSALSVSDVVIEKVTSDEPDNVSGNSDGNTTQDIVINSCSSVQLRAERDLNKNGRVYLITLRVRDVAGKVTRKDFKVNVPLAPNGPSAVQGAAALTRTSSCPF